MYRLRTFGGLALDGPQGSRARASAQRKTLALLAIVAAAGDQGVRRDRLLAVLWPESDTERARGALRQMLHALRHQLEDATPLTGTDPLRLDPAVLTSDVAAFEAALRRGDPAGAVAVYAGPFLDGFFLSDTPEFERWAEGERARMASRYVAALDELARAADAVGDASGALAYWRRLAEVAPLEGRRAIALARRLEAAGDRTGALEHLRAHTALVGAELGAAPDPAVAALAARLRSAGASPCVAADEAPPQPDRAGRGLPDAAPAAGAMRLDGVQPVGEGPAPACPPPGPEAPRPAERARTGPVVRSSRLVRVAVLVLLAGTLALGTVRWRRPGSADGRVVAVLPFRVGGADRGLRVWGEGMVELLDTRIGVESRLRTVDPGTVLRAWRRAGGADTLELGLEQATEVAREVGAGQVLVGALVGTPAHLTLSARLLEAGTARLRAQASVVGPADSILALTDRLAASLLALDAGEGERRLAGLTRTPLPALRAYLEGQSLRRRGALFAAGERYARAVELDSTFALAALQYMYAPSPPGTAGPHTGRGARLAWRARATLDARDSLRLVRDLGTAYPAAPTVTERLAAAEQLVRLAPDDPDAWAALGDLYLVGGATVALPDWIARARRAHERALALEPTRVTSLWALGDVAAQTGDTATLRRLIDRGAALTGVPAGVPHAAHMATLRHALARRRGDLEAAGALRRFLLSDSVPGARWTVAFAALHRVMPAEDGDSALRALVATSATESERFSALFMTRVWELDRGRPERAAAAGAALLDSLALAESDVLHGLYWDGVPRAAARGARVIERALAHGAPLVAASREPAISEAGRTLRRTFALAQYRFVHGDTAGVRRLRRTLPALTPVVDSAGMRELRDALGLVLDAELATAGHAREAGALVARLDSVLRLGDRTSRSNGWYAPFYSVANLVSARLWEARGDVPRALAAVRRRRHWQNTYYEATYLREEARLAALAGDCAGAAYATRAYLTYRPASRDVSGATWLHRCSR